MLLEKDELEKGAFGNRCFWKWLNWKMVVWKGVLLEKDELENGAEGLLFPSGERKSSR